MDILTILDLSILVFWGGSMMSMGLYLTIAQTAASLNDTSLVIIYWN